MEKPAQTSPEAKLAALVVMWGESMSQDVIPELLDADRLALQTWAGELIEAVNAAMQIFSEAFQQFVDAVVDFVNRVIEIVERRQLWVVLDRWHIPGAEWLSEHWPRRFLPGLDLDMWMT